VNEEENTENEKIEEQVAISGDYMDISSHLYLNQTNNDDSIIQANEGVNIINDDCDDNL